MGAFEILLLLFFFGIPLLEGILRKKQPPPGGGQPPRPGQSGHLPRDRTPEAGPAQRPETQARGGTSPGDSASEMVPDELWELLTGQRRDTGTPTMEPGEAEGAERWRETEEAIEQAEIGGDPVSERWEPAIDEFEPVEAKYEREPETLEYVGPEAYTLELPLKSEAVRHREFHDTLDALPPPPGSRRRRGTRLQEALRSSGGLRQAMLLREVLGPPKGLQ